MNKHTPGPWMVNTNFRGDEIVQVGDIENGIQPFGSCSCCGEYIYGDTQAEREANARLIAAAPELLEALKKSLDALGGNNPHDLNYEDSICEYIRAAIAKAEGREVIP